MYGAKPLRIIFVKEDKFIRKDDRSEYLGLFHSNEKHGWSFDGIRYFIMLKRNISDVCFHKYTKIKIDSDDDL